MGLRETGSSLVETMIALFVLAIGLLGMLAMQTKAMQFNQSAYHFSQAIYLANDMSERIRSNLAAANDPAIADAYALASAEAAANNLDCSPATQLSALELARCDLKQWSAQVGERLPEGTVKIERTGDVFEIFVGFDDSRVVRLEDGAEVAPHSYRLVMEI